MSDLLRRSDVLDILGNVFATTLNVEVDAAIAAMMCKIKYMPKVEPDDTTEAYNKGLNDAWELARKIVLDVSKGGIPERDMRSMFGEKWTVSDVLKNYTPQEALAKLEAYEKEQNEIKVGDVVRLKGSDKEYVVTTIDEDRCSEIYCGVSKDGRWFVQCNVKKTGKHIDIQSVLQQIGE